MNPDVVVVGGGVGGLLAALRCSRRGARVCLVEARDRLGGLASSVTFGQTRFDGGPYILLDRQRLRWALQQVDVDLDQLEMVEFDPAFTVLGADRELTTVYHSLEKTCAEMNRSKPGLGDVYQRFVDKATVGLRNVAPLLTAPHNPVTFATSGAWKSTSWVLLSLANQLRRNNLTGPAEQAVTIWTRIAGGEITKAPGPMAFVPALIHSDGAARPKGGIWQVIDLLENELDRMNVEVLKKSPVTSIDHKDNAVSGVTLASGQKLRATTVISDVGGAAALLDLANVSPSPILRMKLSGPLQSPGVAAYLKLGGTANAEVRFKVDGDGQTHAVIHPQTANPNAEAAGRLIAPLSHAEARRLGPSGQDELLESLVDASWWRTDTTGVEVVGKRLVADWGREFRLRDDAMNLVMAKRQMLTGRLPHHIRQLPGLYLTGSWTHPGQWVSFCAVSGVLAADTALEKTSG